MLAFLVTSVWLPDVSWGPARDLLDVNRELSIPTWFSSTQLFVVGAVLLLTTRSNARQDAVSRGTLVAGGAIFVLLSLDEGAGVHERISSAARSVGADWLLFEGGFGAWIGVYAVAAIVVLILGAGRLYRVWQHFGAEARLAALGAAIYVAGAVALEVVSYRFLASGRDEWYLVEVAFEEFLEMAGVSVILYAVLRFANRVTLPLRP